MQQPNLPPGQQGQGQPPQKLTREQKRALAEQKKRMEQQRMRRMELDKLVNNFQNELETSVIDPPLMYKLACNRLKLLLKADHCAAAMFETYEQLGEICLIRQQSNLPPKPQAKEADKPKIKRVIVNGEIIETKVKPGEKKEEDDTPKIPVPQPMPKEPPKSGQLPDLDKHFMHAFKFPEQVRSTRQPLMIPDMTKHTDQPLVQFCQAFGIKSMLVMPVVVNDVVEGMIMIMTVNQPHGYSPDEMSYLQKAIGILSKSIETAPPVLPDKLKDRVITPMTKGHNAQKQIEYYSEFMDDIYAFMIGELEDDEKAQQELLDLQEEQNKAVNRLRKVWYQIGKALEFKEKPQMAYLFNVAVTELTQQAMEFADAKKMHKPIGLKQFQEIMSKMLKRPKISDSFKTTGSESEDDKERKHLVVGNEIMTIDTETGAELDEIREMLTEIDSEVTKAVRGGLLFSEGRRATLINDIEQSEMLSNYVAVTAANDFKQHIKAHMPELHDDIDDEVLLADLAHQGMREISMAVAQNIAEKYVYELENFLDQSEEWQRDRLEELQLYIHYRIMANLVPTLRAEQPTLWANYIADRLKKKAKKAAKQRAVLVGRMVRASASSQDEDDDWDDDEDEDDDD